MMCEAFDQGWDLPKGGPSDLATEIGTVKGAAGVESSFAAHSPRLSMNDNNTTLPMEVGSLSEPSMCEDVVQTPAVSHNLSDPTGGVLPHSHG